MKSYEELLSDIEEDMELMGSSHIVYSMEEDGVVTDYDYLPSDSCTISITLKELQEKLQNIPCKNIFRFSFQLAVDPAGIAPLLHSSQTSGSPLSCTRLFSYHKNRSETAPVPGIPLPAEIEIHLHPAL